MPASDYQVLDPRFARLFNGNAHVDRLYTGCRWAEGPAWFAAGRYLVWSDIPNNRILRYDETNGKVSVFRQPCGNTNGHTVDRQGRLVSCEHSAAAASAAPSSTVRSSPSPTNGRANVSIRPTTWS